ncbi:DNA polymerase I [Parachlamydia acanthamoebae UV-7]|jgi:DNA polymerase-1|uniref:DNA polymerase I n=2 Tax=Parachlamydia acanthamoebae TaxID=83552 RepID=F8KXD8_PARAV|nr:DNA polymerase I [Parachlamydia acanthamoebae]KIA78699.1 DNA polymerase I [Parachlamydia acanthamoebae]CCB85617.1 DNA polymerase I [Parachlamydia acanthamoebae UV-7]
MRGSYNMHNLYVLDASGFLYRSYFAIRNMTNKQGESTNALYGFIRSVLKLFKDFNPEHLVCVFDGPNNAKKRLELYPNYKAHRLAMPPDLRYQIEWAQDFCSLMGIPYLSVPEVEADDTMGTVAKWAEQQGAITYLCTSDKDMAQLVNPHVFLLNTHKDNTILDAASIEKEWGVLPSQMVDLLAMTGDASDNIPGLTGFGEKTAAALLRQFGSLDYILAHPEEVPGKKKQETLQTEADLARISRDLVTIDLSVEIPQEIAFYKKTDPVIDPLKTFYARMNFNSLLRELGQEEPVEAAVEAEKETVEYVLVDEPEAFDALLKNLSSEKQICFDTETTDIQPLKAELVGIGFGIHPKKAWYVPLNGKLGKQRVLEGVKPLFENSAIGFYGHNVKYDWHVLQNEGIQIQNICFDTILASYILNAHSRQHSLEVLALEYFGKVTIPISVLIGKGKNVLSMRDVPIERVTEYCCEDVDFTCRLKEVLEKQLKERDLLNLYHQIELPLLVVLAKMERRGIYVDIPYLEQLSKELTQELKTLQESIYTMAGEEFNLNSPKQVSELLFIKLGIPAPKKTATGHSTSAEVLEFLKNDYPLAGKILEYRLLEKLRSTYVDALPSQVIPRTHRIHSTLNQSVAATGRLSSQDPNLQNIPIRTEEGRKIRGAFRPEKEGWSFLSADYSQIELRLLAHLSQDPVLMAAFQNNEDIHTYTAASMFEIPLGQVSKEQRYQAKAINFGIIYGQQAFGLARELGIEVKQASKFITMYFQRYPKIKEYLDQSKENARATGKSVTLTGRERIIPEILSKNMQIRAAAERLAVNTPLQGTAADLIKMAMLKMDEEIEKQHLKGFMILQIHDELIFEIPDEEISLFSQLVPEVMQNVMLLNVPLVVDINIGKNWKEC